jgi:Prokaryotic E2 family A
MASAVTPIPVARALRQMATHPAVRSLSVTDHGLDTIVTVQLAVQLPSRWQALGASPNGVRSVEPITARFDPNFPAAPPRFFLRPDFDRSHPHIQPRPGNELPEPCLSAAPIAELYLARGVHGLLDQLVLWLERAARLELIAFEQGWEPTRRDHLDDIVVADANWLYTLPRRHGEAQVFEAAFAASPRKPGGPYAVVVGKKATPLRATLLQEFASRENLTIGIAAWSGKLPSGQPFIADQYEPETVTDVSALHARAHRAGCGPELASKLQLLQSRLRGGRLSKPLPVAIVLMARRPCPVIGQDSVWELIPYIVELSGSDDLGPESKKPVRIAMHRQTIGAKLLRRATGEVIDNNAKPWTLLGCGSVGSKLALHLTRAGRPPAYVVDKAWMAPHNYARHALVPMAPHEGILLLPKNFLLAEAVHSFGLSCVSSDADLLGGWKELPDDAISAQDAGLILNATGSLAVRDTLAAAASKARARLAECCLYGDGGVAYVSVEGPDLNPSTADLAAQSYRLFLNDARLSKVVLAASPTEIAIGQGCAALTIPMSDARLSAMTASMASRIASWQAAGLPATAGSILIGELHEDGMSQTWKEHEVKPWTIVRSRSSPITVRISPIVDHKIAEAVAARRGVETGGVLIGRWSDANNSFHVVDLLSAPADSNFSPSLFVLGTEGLSAAIADIVARSHGSLYALGTWHNHLADSGPSRLDRHTAKLLAHQQQIPVLLLIHTPGGYRFLTAESLCLPAAFSRPAVISSIGMNS